MVGVYTLSNYHLWPLVWLASGYSLSWLVYTDLYVWSRKPGCHAWYRHKHGFYGLETPSSTILSHAHTQPSQWNSAKLSVCCLLADEIVLCCEDVSIGQFKIDTADSAQSRTQSIGGYQHETTPYSVTWCSGSIKSKQNGKILLWRCWLLLLAS